MPATKSIQEELLSIVGSANLRLATQEDAICGIVPQFVIEPENEQQLAAALSCADAAGASVVPRGGATKLGWGNPPKRADLILSARRMNRIVEHVWADLTVTVEAGCTLQSLQATLAKHGQRLAFDGLWPERATIGGVLSTNDSGALRLRFGSLRDLVIGVTLALPIFRNLLPAPSALWESSRAPCFACIPFRAKPEVIRSRRGAFPRCKLTY
jgi:glycolate oxidase FAD binding subunit